MDEGAFKSSFVLFLFKGYDNLLLSLSLEIDMENMNYVDVIVPLAIDALYTYRLPDALFNRAMRGMLVHVAFAGEKIYTGIIYRIHKEHPQGYTVKDVIDLVDEQLIMNEQQLQLVDWISSYYQCSRGEVIKAALPTLFRLESYSSIVKLPCDIPLSELTPSEQQIIRFLDTDRHQSLLEIEQAISIKNIMIPIRSLLKKEMISIKENMNALYLGKQERWIMQGEFFSELSDIFVTLLRRSAVQQRIVAQLMDTDFQSMERSRFLKEFGCSSAVLNALIEKKVLTQEERIVDSFETIEEGNGVIFPLSESQRRGFEQVKASFERTPCVLLHGVTSSGKTELYIHLIKEQLEQGKQVLYLLPEIALTIQIVKRLRRSFGDCVGIYHSGMSDKLRVAMWRKQCSETPYRIILGVRSSLFLPFQSLGLVIVDEEHESSFKQSEPAPRYHGRDTAIVLATLFNAKVLLGSATPSFESFNNAQQGKYGYVLLDKRHNEIELPEILIANMAEYRRKKLLKGSLSPLLIEEMTRVLNQGNQVLLFQNRRGYSTFIMCDRCGAVPKCKHCDVSMTYYKHRSILSCHYCGTLQPMESRCSSCGEGTYKMCTPGTEKIEEEVQQLFPDKVVARMDLEVMNSKRKSHAVIDSFEKGEIDILVGTQMIAKGLDFERVKLVGVIDADSMLNFPDFRAEERAYSLLTQVSGRSGRSGERGKVVIQLANISNPIMGYVQNTDYDGLFKQLAPERKIFGYPPYTRLIELELRGKDVVRLRQASNTLARQLRELYGARVCGPAVPLVGRMQDMYRIHILLKLELKAPFARIKLQIKQLIAALLREKGYSAIRVISDVDPY